MSAALHPALVSIPSFRTLGVPQPLLKVLAADGKSTPFPIQVDTLPDTLAGRDVLGRGKTGSGKTLAFCIPLAARIGAHRATVAHRPRTPLGLVLAPTRELATQINAVLEPLAAAVGLTTTTIFGGVSQSRQVAALGAGVDIVVACPGRLEDLMAQKAVSLEAIEMTVIDEADHMADLGFLPGVTRILKATPRQGQRLLFSATLDNGVDVLVRQFLSRPVMHSVDEANAPVPEMTHHVFDVAGADEKKRLVEALAGGVGRRILFMRTKHQAKRLAKQLTTMGIPAVELQGNLSQPRREANLAAFSEGRVRVLVATDVAARGVHVDDVELVVHVDPPTEHKAYLHRSGRTARAGSRGDVVTLVLPEQRKDTADVLRKADIRVRPRLVTAESPEVRELIGEVAARVAFVEVAPVAPPAAPKKKPAAPAARPFSPMVVRDGATAPSPRGGGRRGRGGARTGGQGARADGGDRAPTAPPAASTARGTRTRERGPQRGERPGDASPYAPERAASRAPQGQGADGERTRRRRRRRRGGRPEVRAEP
ncbi:MAG: DEAD/DEAH box helicase [Gemmatimonadaceae bacterium]|nr:DEAD/DEAH box helicase [Gemmatimonadaceae bacterium]